MWIGIKIYLPDISFTDLFLMINVYSTVLELSIQNITLVFEILLLICIACDPTILPKNNQIKPRREPI